MFDVHIHTGHFNDGLYFSPQDIARGMKALNIERCYFSSTSTGNVPFREVRREIEELISLSKGRALPFLWVSPGMLRHSASLRPYFFREFAGLKVHGLQGWNPDGPALRKVFGIALDMNLPVMLHTGEHEVCRAGAYMKICRDFHDVRIILAHGRPIDECIAVMKECPNAWTDTAFMPVSSIIMLKDNGLLSRVLWGSDFPVMRYYYEIPATEYYMKSIDEAKNILGNENFSLITHDNFMKFFDNKNAGPIS